jgi:hypothetical protein
MSATFGNSMTSTRQILLSLFCFGGGALVGGSLVGQFSSETAYSEKMYADTMLAAGTITDATDSLDLLSAGKIKELESRFRNAIVSAGQVLERYRPEMTEREMYYYVRVKPLVDGELREK